MDNLKDKGEREFVRRSGVRRQRVTINLLQGEKKKKRRKRMGGGKRGEKHPWLTSIVVVCMLLLNNF